MASLCINRRLYLIATSNAVTITKAEKRRSVMIDLAIGLGVPILEMILRKSNLIATEIRILIHAQTLSHKATDTTSLKM